MGLAAPPGALNETHMKIHLRSAKNQNNQNKSKKSNSCLIVIFRMISVISLTIVFEFCLNSQVFSMLLLKYKPFDRVRYTTVILLV